jgi:hypothetical protein
MPSIYVKFKNYNELVLRISDSDLGKQYCALVRQNYEQSRPIFRDRPRYTVEYMLELARQAKTQLNWDWSFDHYDVSITALLHKDIERLLGTDGFNSVPEELDNLLHELHYCLHIVQDGSTNKRRVGWLQIEWYNDNGFPLLGTDLFKQYLKFGDIRLQNPYVGHGPLQIFLEKDFSNIPQTCKFHNFVKPGINITINNIPFVDPQVVLESFKQHYSEFVDLHTPEKILSYTGYPVIGVVENLKDLHAVAAAPVLELEYINFDE